VLDALHFGLDTPSFGLDALGLALDAHVLALVFLYEIVLGPLPSIVVLECTLYASNFTYYKEYCFSYKE